MNSEFNPELGQVFTSPFVADFMTNLFSFTPDDEHTLLDPCFGGGVFVNSLMQKGYTNITGYEIDDYWFSKTEKRFPGVDLHKSSFLDAPEDIKYTGIIMNPPYIRQEKIDDMKDMGITKKIIRENPIYHDLPKTANMYMYFIVKAINLLAENGELVVIFPNSWAKARSGKSFENYLNEYADVTDHIDLYGEVFTNSAIVEVCILRIVKRKSSGITVHKSLTVKDGEFSEASKCKETADFSFSEPFSSFGTVRRGLTTGCNEIFVNPNPEYCLDEYLKPIISSPKNFTGFNTDNASTDSLLVADEGTVFSAELERYLESCKDDIVQNQQPKTLYDKIMAGKSWYSLPQFECKGIIFSYFVRMDMKFAVNRGNCIIRDNFYVITPEREEDLYFLFSLLNNHFTFLQLEKTGKKYGAGLLKLQRYDIENLKFPDYSVFTPDAVARLSVLGKQLADTSDLEIITEITHYIAQLTGTNAVSVISEVESIKETRLTNA